MDGRRLRLALVASGAALLALAVHATAAPFDPTLAVNATFPSGPLTPFVDLAGFPSLDEVTVRVPMHLDYTVPQGHVTTSPTTVGLDVADKPFWLDVAFQPVDVTFETPPGVATGTRTYSRVVQVVLHATNTAPTGTQGAVELTATARNRAGVPLAAGAVQGLVEARPYVVLEAAADDPTPTLEPFGETTVDVSVVNVGNALVAAVAEVAYADAGIEASVPSVPVVLKPNPLAFQRELEARDIPVTVRHRSGPGGEVLILVTAALREDGWLVQDRVVRLHIDVAEAPSPGAGLPLLALGAVAGAGLLLGARKA